MAFECMDDCIHLKACRRVQQIGKRHRLLVPRYCTKECSAYRSSQDVWNEREGIVKWTVDEVIAGADWVKPRNKELYIAWIRGDDVPAIYP